MATGLDRTIATGFDVTAIGLIFLAWAAWSVVNMAAGVLARKLSTLYDYQNDIEIEWKMLPFYSVGFGLFSLVIVACICFAFRSSLHWHHSFDEDVEQSKDKSGQV
jgi:hypothetical protein